VLKTPRGPRERPWDNAPRPAFRPATTENEDLLQFKNLIVYRIGEGWAPDLEALEASLAATPFTECAASQPLSAGWTWPRGAAHGRYAEPVGGQWLMKLLVEQKVLPASVVKRRTVAMAAEIEKATGRKPGKRQLKELKDEATTTLLPQAFTKQAATGVWLDPQARLLMVDAGSAARADEVVTRLLRAQEGLLLAPLQTAQSAGAAMSDWLVSGDPPAPFSIDRECELKSADGMKSVVRYARHALDIDEVREHIAAGKQPTRLALTWDGRVSFTLTEAMQIRKLAFLDGVFEGAGASPAAASQDEAFDADAAIATGELARLLPALIEALGGELAFGAAVPMPQAATGAATGAASRGTAVADAAAVADDGSAPW
jgi:recombination associated protein RdgC